MKNLKVVHFLRLFRRLARVTLCVHMAGLQRFHDGKLRLIGALVAGIRNILAGLQPQPKLVPIPVRIAASPDGRRSNARRRG